LLGVSGVCRRKSADVAVGESSQQQQQQQPGCVHQPVTIDGSALSA